MTRASSFILFRRIVISLVLGVALTYASAWGIALLVRSEGGANSNPSGIGDVWSYWIGRDFGTVIIKRRRAHFVMQEPLKRDYLAVRARTIPRWSAVLRPPKSDNSDGDDRDDEVGKDGDDSEGVTFVEDARGWPLIALASESAVTRDDAGNASVITRGGMALNADARGGSRSFARRIVLPLRPLGFAFVGSVLAYAAFAFAVCCAPGMLRRAVRRRLGHCERCGYNLSGVMKRTVCPECGTRSCRDPASRFYPGSE